METGLQTVNQQRKLGEWAERVSACRSSGLIPVHIIQCFRDGYITIHPHQWQFSE